MDAPDPTPDRPEPELDAALEPAGRGGQGRTLLVGVGVVALVLVGVVALSARGQDPGEGDASERPPVAASAAGTATPAFGLTDAVAELPETTFESFAGSGETTVADLLGGPPLVLNFWATWCAPCVAEMPDLQRLHDAAGDAVRLVGINTQDAVVNAEPFAADLGITYDLVADRDGSWFRDTGGFGMPTTLLVHPDGSVAYRHTGVLTAEQAVDLLAEHLDVTVTLPG